MYYEADVLMYKLRRRNWVNCLEPRAKIVHKRGVDNSKLAPTFF